MAEPPSGSNPPPDDILLSRALAGDGRAWAKLTDRFDRYLAKIIRGRAADLPEDIQEEIKQELWGAVARRGPRPPNEAIEPAKAYIGRFLRSAVDRVRSAYRAPGTHSRWRNEMPEWDAPTIVDMATLTEHEDDVSSAELRRIEARLEVEALVASALPIVAAAAMLMLRRGYNVSETARATGLKQVALHRALRALGRRAA